MAIVVYGLMMEQQSIPVHGQQSDIFIMFSVIMIYYDVYGTLCTITCIVDSKIFFYKRDQKISDKLRINHHSHAEKSQFLNDSIRQSLKCRHTCIAFIIPSHI